MIIYCHPNNVKRLKREDIIKRAFDGTSVFSNIKIIEDECIPEKIIVGWERTKKAKEKFIDWISEEDLIKPKEWHKYFGFVEPIYETYVYMMPTKGYAIYHPDKIETGRFI